MSPPANAYAARIQQANDLILDELGNLAMVPFDREAAMASIADIVRNTIANLENRGATNITIEQSPTDPTMLEVTLTLPRYILIRYEVP